MLMTSFNHFWSQVIESATICSSFFRLHKLRPSEICYFHVVIFINQYILQFKISMHYLFGMYLSYSLCDLSDILRCSVLREFLVRLRFKERVEVPISRIFEYQINVNLILKMIVKLNYTGMIQLIHDLDLFRGML